LLRHTKSSVLDQLSGVETPSKLSGNEFELIVYENSVINAKSTPFEGLLRHTEDREFPDIIAADLFGVEVKATKKDDWTSIGNSVLESSRVKTVDKIYMFFGKLGGTPDIKYRNYEDCLKGIAVTHYPRYQIDMLLNESDSIFKKMGVEYDAIRTSRNPVKAIREYYRSQMREGDALWWIDDDLDKTATVSPIIRNLSGLDAATRDQVKADLFVKFPEIFSTSRTKYENIPAYLAARYGVVTANLRDHFTASGQVEVSFSDKVFRAPRIIGELVKLAELISAVLGDESPQSLSNAWRKHVASSLDTAEKAWAYELDRNTAHMELPVRASILYGAALEGEVKIEGR